MTSNPTPTLPTVEALITELQQQPGFQSLMDGVPDERERKTLEESVVALMRSYYDKVLKPLSNQ